MHKQFLVSHEEDMLALGAQLATVAENGVVIFLSGQLGAGKTTIVRGFLRRLGWQAKVKSPTFTLVESYDFKETQVFHFDFYRLQGPSELAQLGIHDYLLPSAICLIEWPEKVTSCLPTPDLACLIAFERNGRNVVFEAHSKTGEMMLRKLAEIRKDGRSEQGL